MRYIFVLLLLAFTPSLQARNIPESYLNDLENINIYVQTVDEGNLVYDNFGHTLVRVENIKTRKNFVFNWGVFSFGDPVGFALNFYKGLLNYTLGISDYSYMLRVFHYERRAVYEDKIALDSEQKKIFLEKLIWNQKKENRNYLYKYFDDNCSTRPRDYLDLALGGEFKKQFDSVESKQTYRQIIRKAYASIPPMSMILDTILNSEIDKNMSVWQKAFLPAAFRKLLLNANIKGEKLVSSSHKLVDFKEKIKYSSTGYEIFLVIFGLIILLEILYMNFPKIAFIRRLVSGALITVYGIWAGILGGLFPITWMVSDHEILKHNVLMLLYFPVDIYFVFLGLGLIFKNKIACKGFFRKFMTSHALAYGLLIILFYTGLTSQDISRSLYFVCPGMLLTLFLLSVNDKK